jgi:hypothetical protein
MQQGDRPEAPTDQPKEPCTREEHEQLKRNARAFRRATHYVGVQGGRRKAVELRNCSKCGSTLTAPRKKPSKGRRVQTLPSR